MLIAPQSGVMDEPFAENPVVFLNLLVSCTTLGRAHSVSVASSLK